MSELREYCGIVGVIGTPRASRVVHLALYALQHRGQEGSGMVAFDGEQVRAHKAEGLVSDIFDDAVLEGLPGDLAIGHNRYSTFGGASLENCQPLVAIGRNGEVAVAHNGNLVNGEELRRQMEEQNAVFQSTSDTEVILHRIATSREPSVEQVLFDALRPLQGAFSLVIGTRDEVIAVKDPWGFRPLCYGQLPDGGWIIASESCALDIVEANLVREVDRGEAVIFDRQGNVRTTRLPWSGEQQMCIFEFIYFSRPDSQLHGKSVDRVRRALGRKLAQEHPVAADCVMAVPDSSNSAALGYAEWSGIPFELGLIRNHYVGRTFINPTQEMRENRARIKFNPVRSLIEGRRIVLVDDSIVRGTTGGRLIKMLWRTGAREIHLRISSPPIVSPCYYGIDTPEKGQLIAANNTVAEIAERIGVTSLAYLSHDGMLDVSPRDIGYCTACFTGDYPVPRTAKASPASARGD